MVRVNRSLRSLLSRFGILPTVALVVILVISGCKSPAATSTTPSSSTTASLTSTTSIAPTTTTSTPPTSTTSTAPTSTFITPPTSTASTPPTSTTSTPPTSTTTSPALLTEQQAIQDLLNNVIKPSSLTHDEIAFTLTQPLAAGTQVAPYAPDPLPAVVTSLPDLVPQTLTATSWFFWVDDDPIARFSHPSRFVFIDAITGVATVSNQGWWPYINGQEVAQWDQSPGRWNPSNWAYSNVPQSELSLVPTTTPPTSATQASFLLSPAANTPVPNGAPPGNAIVPVNGWDPSQVDVGTNVDMQHESQFGQSSGIPSYPPVHTGLQGILDAITSAVNGGATDVFFYFTGHGGKWDNGTPFIDFKGIGVSPKNLTDMFAFYPNVKFKVVLDSCNSGAFSTALTATVNVPFFFSACAQGEKAYGGGINDGGALSDGLWEDLTNVLNTPALQTQAATSATNLNEDPFVGWLDVAHISALQKDTKYQDGSTHPVYYTETAPTFVYSFTDNGNYTSSMLLTVPNWQPGWTVTAIFSGPGGTSTQTSTYLDVGWTVSIPGIYKVTATVTDSLTGKVIGTYTGSENVQ